MARVVKVIGAESMRISNGPGCTEVRLHRTGRGVTLEMFGIENYAAFSGRKTLRALAFAILDATGGREG